MKKILAALVALAGLGLLLVIGSFFWEAYFHAQRADYGWSPKIAAPTHTKEHPIVLFDEGHHNASTAGFAGRYWPFARLLAADGYRVRRGTKAFTPGDLDGVRILVIANASAAAKPQAFGINLPLPGSEGERGAPAFKPGEIEVVRSWVESGGSLLLVADHAPFGAASAAMGEAFGVGMRRGFLEVPGEVSDPLLFSDANGRLGDHPIVNPGGPGERVRRVMTFTGQSLDAPAGATILLLVPDGAIEYVQEGDSLPARPAGRAQGLAFPYGRGRVVVLGEAAMITAQVSARKPFGMNSPGNDNRRFAIHVMRWLSGKL